MKKLLSIILIICILVSVISITASAETEYTKPYQKEFVEYIDKYFDEKPDGYRYNGPIYSYYSEDNISDTPEWVLVFGATNYIEYWPYFIVYGDYYFRGANSLFPFQVTYYVYVVSENKFYHISSAIKNNLEGIDTAFTEHLLNSDNIGIVGDFDGDDKLTVFDATGIQRALAGMCDFSSNDQWVIGENSEYITDFDRDGERTVMDATAIQRHIAGLE